MPRSGCSALHGVHPIKKKLSLHFHVQIILFRLGIPLPHEDGFRKVQNSYTKSAYYSICSDYGVNSDEIWMNGNSFVW